MIFSEVLGFPRSFNFNRTQRDNSSNFLLTNSIIFRFFVVWLLIWFHVRWIRCQYHQHRLYPFPASIKWYFIYLRYLAVKHINKWKISESKNLVFLCLRCLKKGYVYLRPCIGHWRLCFLQTQAEKKKRTPSSFRRNGHIFIISSHIHVHSNNFSP